MLPEREEKGEWNLTHPEVVERKVRYIIEREQIQTKVDSLVGVNKSLLEQ